MLEKHFWLLSMLTVVLLKNFVETDKKKFQDSLMNFLFFLEHS